MGKYIITGSVPYRGFKDKLKIIKGLEKEFDKQVKISESDGIITYIHTHNDDSKSMLNNY